jgi:valyl-tRNA synthetase
MHPAVEDGSTPDNAPDEHAIPKVYDPSEVEGRIYKWWERAGYFHAEVDPAKQPFCIVIPPPNVTGVLHIGHALDNTLQDILIRYKRMQGYSALWVPGTDHAGIATQNVVERHLREQGLTRHDLGREEFVERVWEWKDVYGSRIIQQLKRLGASCDWGRERFTMDQGLSAAVRKVFVDLYNEGLIYRGNRIINWCPRCETALSDIEVDHSEYEGRLDRFRYPFEDGSGHLSVATTRLETMLGDVAVAVNPGDQRYTEAVGKSVVHPFDGRLLPIVADDAVDPNFGTGAVKVTPAHDQTDFEIAERHNLPKVNIFDGTARVTVAGPFEGMDRVEAREQVAVELEKLGLYEGHTPHSYAIGRCSRCGTIVEPWLSDQWFVKMQPLAEPAIAAMKDSSTRFHPSRWVNYYLNWMEQIRDWCISRQLWWGHRIPVWYCDNGHTWAAEKDPTECPECGSEKIVQDPDVLDTWFSSQLWPFSTLGWPEQTPDLEYFYPTSVLVTGYEIIHLWVARMMMAGLHFMGEVPFGSVVVHGIVRDAQGRKMSKSIGNVIDPLVVIDKYGTDALRFTLTEHATGQDIFLDTDWVAGARNFANKLWNAARFVLANAGTDENVALPPAGERLELADRWILSRVAATATEVTSRLDEFEFAQAARLIYDFIWSEFCDWYIEASKPRLYSEDRQVRDGVRSVLVAVLDEALRLAHPVMPFITEEIWGKLPMLRPVPSIMVAPWPSHDPGSKDHAAEADFGQVQQIVSAIRSFRSTYRIDPKAQVAAVAVTEDPALADLVATQAPLIRHLARLADLRVASPVDEPAGARLVAGAVDLVIPLEGLLDVEAERARLRKATEKAAQEIERLTAKLADDRFVFRAPAEVVVEQRRRLEEANATRAKLTADLALLGLT